MDGVWGTSNATIKLDDGKRTFNASPNAREYRSEQHQAGRWPGTLIHDGSDEVLEHLGEKTTFFYCPKVVGAKARNGSKHSTMKPLELMRYLVRMITPPGGMVLDPFAGSGTTGEAAELEGVDYILIERNPQHIEDIERRLNKYIKASAAAR